jgi:hypothetical protein
VVYLLFRKKLFRSKAAASPRLQEQDEFFVGAHGLDSGKRGSKTTPRVREAQGTAAESEGRKKRK